MGDQVAAVVLDELDGGGPARSFRFGAALGLVQFHRLHISRYLPFTDHPDRLAAVWPSRLELQGAGRRGDE